MVNYSWNSQIFFKLSVYEIRFFNAPISKSKTSRLVYYFIYLFLNKSGCLLIFQHSKFRTIQNIQFWINFQDSNRRKISNRKGLMKINFLHPRFEIPDKISMPMNNSSGNLYRYFLCKLSARPQQLSTLIY